MLFAHGIREPAGRAAAGMAAAGLDGRARVAAADILRDGAEGLVWDKAEAVNAELRAQMMYWSLVHGFAQLYISGHFQKEGFNAVDILDIVPAFQHKA